MSDLRHILRLTLERDLGLEPARVNQCCERVILHLCRGWGGQRVYIAKQSPLRPERNAAIADISRNGASARAVARKLGISPGTVLRSRNGFGSEEWNL